MKKIYSFLFFVLLCSNAFAEGDGNYYWFYDRVEAAPTGKGVVYAAESSDPQPAENDYQESVEVKFSAQGYPDDDIYAWAKPAEGYQFAGWFSSATDETTLEELLSDADSAATLDVTTASVSEDEFANAWGFTPDDTLYGIFTKVVVQAPDVDCVGSATISKVANDTGDEITLTATPANETVKFDYWLDSEGNKVETNPYTFTVSDVETYKAHFSGDSIITIDFGEGKYIPFSSIYSASFTSGITEYSYVKTTSFTENGQTYLYDETTNTWGYYDDDYNFIEYPGTPQLESTYALIEWASYIDYDAGTGIILYGEGEQYIVFHKDEDPDPYPSFIVGTAEGAVNIAELPAADEEGNAITYYTFNGTDFEKATSGIVEQGECYLALDASHHPLPDKIPFTEDVEELAGIDAPTVDAPAALAAPAVKGIYTIDGKRIARPIKGAINIIDGKKVFVK